MHAEMLSAIGATQQAAGGCCRPMQNPLKLARQTGTPTSTPSTQTSAQRSPSCTAAAHNSLLPCCCCCASLQRGRSAIVSTAEVQTTETTPTIQYDSHKPHGDASETGSAVVLEHPSDQRKATVVRNIVFITSEVGAAIMGGTAGMGARAAPSRKGLAWWNGVSKGSNAISQRATQGG